MCESVCERSDVSLLNSEARSVLYIGSERIKSAASVVRDERRPTMTITSVSDRVLAFIPPSNVSRWQDVGKIEFHRVFREEKQLHEHGGQGGYLPEVIDATTQETGAKEAVEESTSSTVSVPVKPRG
jgi:hypothetical protein